MARTIAKDHDEKRAQILKSAAKVFAEQGFDRASMTQLARECGISKANIYHYYDSKDAVLFGILDTYLSDLRDRVCGVDVSALSPDQRLRRIVSEILLAYQGADHEHQVQISAMGALPEEQQKLLRAYQRELVQLVSDALAGVAAEGIAKDPAKLRAATMSVFGMLNWYYMWNSGAGPEAREDYAQMVADLTMNGIRSL
ncbi:TetR/AcrR family transcriptional regulator [Phaeobacter gallaeciensis]|uniref:Transcriptional regulator, TetR family n=1 Tax=Phaeobacter gallaeciensis TaxID=60890 RepID=A0AAC9Z6E1_9RHOB|nr:TetR/AcrR family transcriptional regulator [Phaeobacter gallaeciensis]AHD08532.1 transcriptional regulator, TetR family [Phaeobacter gallaeciensis DSM 26640]ATE91798.1 transcriptional regulator, TetR family [Phaeobacter gallaeciensis]ATE98378.1 transcriptional regulator, TetR family [Phaeobacter gallaeciensis]ATF00414.1 transcriptional regulator, TetR family [Phaeobacter gallaeciensis]ATF04846.1 transcriptional regulator, TetR family [Phaeobacter gallaeciensis]